MSTRTQDNILDSVRKLSGLRIEIMRALNYAFPLIRRGPRRTFPNRANVETAVSATDAAAVLSKFTKTSGIEAPPTFQRGLICKNYWSLRGSLI
jgi:hypothetical protein